MKQEGFSDNDSQQANTAKTETGPSVENESAIEKHKNWFAKASEKTGLDSLPVPVWALCRGLIMGLTVYGFKEAVHWHTHFSSIFPAAVALEETFRTLVEEYYSLRRQMEERDTKNPEDDK